MKICCFDLIKCFNIIGHTFQVQMYIDNELKWLKNYMSNRWHVVHYDDHGKALTREYMKTGAPQGSVLGRLMCFIQTWYQHNKSCIIEVFINLFTDDASLYSMGTDFFLEKILGNAILQM